MCLCSDMTTSAPLSFTVCIFYEMTNSFVKRCLPLLHGDPDPTIRVNYQFFQSKENLNLKELQLLEHILT